MPTEVKLLRHVLVGVPVVNVIHAAMLSELRQNYAAEEAAVRLFYFETNDIDAYFWFLNANLTSGEFTFVRAGYHSTGLFGLRKRYYVYLKSVPPVPVPGPYIEIEIGPVSERKRS